jgi:hypothetical protein
MFLIVHNAITLWGKLGRWQEVTKLCWHKWAIHSGKVVIEDDVQCELIIGVAASDILEYPWPEIENDNGTTRDCKSLYSWKL